MSLVKKHIKVKGIMVINVSKFRVSTNDCVVAADVKTELLKIIIKITSCKKLGQIGKPNFCLIIYYYISDFPELDRNNRIAVFHIIRIKIILIFPFKLYICLWNFI